MDKRKIFIERSKLKHNDKYDYSLVDYINSNKKVKIICKDHGVFEQTPNHHILRGQGCKKCSDIRLSSLKTSNSIEFINKSIKLYGDKYDYTNVIYKDAKTKVDIYCKGHNIMFSMNPNNHLSGQVCSLCSGCVLNTNIFIEKSNNIHKNKYDYSLVKYEHSQKYVRIICKKHGDFLQKPNDHIQGAGCIKCSFSKGENFIMNYMNDNNINYIHQYSFDDCKYKNKLKFDFYLPDYNICIEYDGEQHFRPIDYFGGNDRFKHQKVMDEIKNKYCENKNIKMLRIPYYYKYSKVESILENLNNL